MLKFDLLSEHAEKELTEKYFKTKSIHVRDKLVLHNMKLVYKIAHKYSFTADNLEDLIQEGCMGLTRAIEKFDPNKNVSLGSYAYYWIRAYVLRYIMNNARLVKVGTTVAQRKLFFNLAKTKSKYESLGIHMSDEDLAQEFGIKLKEFRDIEQHILSPSIRLDSYYPEDNNKEKFMSKSLHEAISSDKLSPEHLTEQLELHNIINDLVPKFICTLSKKDKMIFNRRLFNDKPDTLDSIGKDLSLTRERIRQIELNIKDKFKSFLKRNQINEAA